MRTSPYLLLVLTTLFWSGNFVIGRAMRADIPPLALSFWRWALALIILWPLAWAHLKAQRALLRRHWRLLALLGILGVSNFNTFVYLGLHSTTATNAVLTVSITPVIIVALSFLLLRQPIGPGQGLGILSSLFGVMLIVSAGEPSRLLGQRLNPGDLWVLAAVASWALYSVLLRWRPRELHPLAFLTATVAAGTAVLAPVYLWELAGGARLAPTPATLATLGYVAVFPSVLAFIFWNRAVQELGANRAGQFMHLMPAFGTLLSMAFLGERLYAYHALGIGLIVGGIYLATVRAAPSQ